MRVPVTALLLLLITCGVSAQSVAVVEGKVVSASDGTPVRKATVLVRSAAADGDSYLAQSDASGHFAVEGVVPGIYECLPSRPGFEPGPPDRKVRPVYVTLAAGQHLDSLVLRLMPVGVISGRVLDADGQPLPDAEVSALQYSYSALGRTLTVWRLVTSDDHGEFRLFGLYPGAYYLRASPLEDGAVSQYRSFGPAGVNRGRFLFGPPHNPVRGPAPPPLSATYYPDALDQAQARAVEIAAGGEVRGSDIHVQRRVHYSIRGRAPAGRPGPIRARSQSETGEIFPFGSMSDGNFEVRGVPPGSYVLESMLPNPTAEGARLARASVEVTNQDVDGVQLEELPALRLAGVVRSAGKGTVTVKGMEVALLSDDGRRFSMEAKADGSFAGEFLMPGIYHVTLGAAVYATSIKLGDKELADGVLDLQRQIDANLTVTVSDTFGSVTGQVIGDDGQPLPAAAVSLIPDQAAQARQTRYQEADADAAGRFVFAKVVPGHYRVFAWRDVPSGAPQDAEFRAPFEKLGTSLTVEPGGRQTLECKAIDAERRQ